MSRDQSLFNGGFVGLTLLFFFASSAMAAFFQLQPYLQSIHLDPAWIGFIIGADSLASFIIQPLCAPYLHAGNARRWIVTGIIGMAAALVAYSFATGLGTLIVIRIAQGAGFVLFLAALMAGIVAYIPASRSGEAFGFLSLVRLLPYALVPPAATFLMKRSFTFPAILLFFAALISFSLLVLVFVRSSMNAEKSGTQQASGPIGIKGAIEGLRNKSIQMILFVNLLVFVCYTVVFFYISGYGTKAGIDGTAVFFTIATVMMVAVRLSGKVLFDRFNKFHVAAWCLAILALSFLFLPHARDWGFYCLAGLFGLAWGVVMPLLNAIVFDISPPHLRGVNLNLALVAMQGGFFLGPLAGGIILGTNGYTVLFTLCCPVTFIALLAVLAAKPTKGVTADEHGQAPAGSV